MQVMLVDGAGFSPPYDFALAHAMRARGTDVCVVIPPECVSLWENPEAVPRFPIRRIDRPGTWRKGCRYALDICRLLDRVRTEKPDIVHFQWTPLPVVDGWALSRLRGMLPLVFTMHNTSLFHGSATSRIQGWGSGAVRARFDRIIVHSDFGYQHALATGSATAAQLVRIPHGAFSHYRALASPDAERTDSPVTLLFAGSIKPYKGLEVLIRAIARAQTKLAKNSFRLVVAGQPSMPMNELFQLAQSLEIDHVIDWRLRHQSERELADALQQAHVVVLPYLEIDQSGVMLAAVAMGRAVIASRIGALPEVITDGVNGLLVAPNDVGALSEALVRMVSSPQLRERCERATESLARGSLSWSNVAEQTLGVYRSLLSRRVRVGNASRYRCEDPVPRAR